jgi:hypothetical protein
MHAGGCGGGSGGGLRTFARMRWMLYDMEVVEGMLCVLTVEMLCMLEAVEVVIHVVEVVDRVAAGAARGARGAGGGLTGLNFEFSLHCLWFAEEEQRDHFPEVNRFDLRCVIIDTTKGLEKT